MSHQAKCVAVQIDFVETQDSLLCVRWAPQGCHHLMAPIPFRCSHARVIILNATLHDSENHVCQEVHGRVSLDPTVTVPYGMRTLPSYDFDVTSKRVSELTAIGAGDLRSSFYKIGPWGYFWRFCRAQGVLCCGFPFVSSGLLL